MNRIPNLRFLAFRTKCHISIRHALYYMQVLLEVARKVGASKVYCHSEVTYEEAATEKRVAAALKAEDIQLKTVWGSTLFDVEDLPFKIEDTPASHGVCPYICRQCCSRNVASSLLQYPEFRAGGRDISMLLSRRAAAWIHACSSEQEGLVLSRMDFKDKCK